MAESPIVATNHLEPYPRLSPSHLQHSLGGKTVLITGGGYGIGASIAAAFAAAGVAHIILAGRTEARLQSTAAELRSASSASDTLKSVTCVVVDIVSPTAVVDLFKSLKDDKSPDILVNNAGFLSTPENFVDADLVDWWDGFEINVLGTARVTQAYLQHRRRAATRSSSSRQPGVVITVNTLGAFTARAPNLSGYVASKAAQLRMMEMVAADVSPDEARFISVHPGAVKTEMGRKSGLDGKFPHTDGRLAAEFIAWTATEEAEFLGGRFVSVNWDLDELLAKKAEIVDKDLLITSLRQ